MVWLSEHQCVLCLYVCVRASVCMYAHVCMCVCVRVYEKKYNTLMCLKITNYQIYESHDQYDVIKCASLKTTLRSRLHCIIQSKDSI